MIESGKFMPKLESFSPEAVLEFILAIFKPQAELQATRIEYETVNADDLDEAFDHDHNKMMMAQESLPPLLVGD